MMKISANKQTKNITEQLSSSLRRMVLRVCMLVMPMLFMYSLKVQAAGWVDCLNYSQDINVGQTYAGKFTKDDSCIPARIITRNAQNIDK